MPIPRWFRRLRLRARRRRRRRLPARVVAGLGAALLVVATAPTPAGAQGAAPDPDPYVPPVDAPVVDGFRPPPRPFGPGNRGLEYDTEPGTAVRASADGQVVFAGAVAGSLHVTVQHADGIRTSYSFLARIDVVAGQRVRQGDRVGTAGDRLHFGARQGDAYFDPATLFAAVQVEVELLPFEVPPGATADEERAALLQLAMPNAGGGWGIDLPGPGDIADWAAERARLLRHYAGRVLPLTQGAGLARDLTARLVSPPPCTDAPVPHRPAAGGRERVAVLVGGLGSSSRSASIDRLRTDDLGYGLDHVVRFSYAGGRTPGSGGILTAVEARPYGSADTQGGLQPAAARLADLVEATAAARPGGLVDVYAHSMGGVVTRLALQELVRRGFDLERIGLVATFGAPHRGAGLATAVAAAHTSAPGTLGVDLLSEALDTGLDPGSPAVAQLAETSPVIAELDAAGVPEGVELLSLAASGDVVVAAPNTAVDGARNVTVGLAGRQAHGDLVASDAATDEVARALAGQPRGCEDPWEIVTEELTGHAVAYAEDLGGFAVLRSGG